MRKNYWSCSPFADWLRGTAKPEAETSQGWNLWNRAAQASHPVRYWLAEDGLDAVQNFVHWPLDRLNDVRYYINNRWVSRTHACTAHPKDIRPGEWSDVGNRFLPCLFNELVDFVEIEQAWHHCCWDTEARRKYSTPWWRSGWLRWRAWRCPEAGLAYLDWAGGLVADETWGVHPGASGYGEPTHQALAAREIKELYTWWKEVRPQRPDPYISSGWNQLCQDRRDMWWDDETEEQRAETRDRLDRLSQLEAEYEREDEEMLIRLIRVRRHLWT